MKTEEKEEIYRELILKLDAMEDPQLGTTVNILNALSLLKYDLNLFWTGIYWVKGDNLFLGPYQGMTACTKIKMGKGVCGTVASTGEISIVEDVNQIENYIACHAEAKSEIVVPGKHDGKVIFVLDVDSDHAGAFDEADATWLSQVNERIVRFLSFSER